MSIYDITFSLQANRLLPPSKRLPKWLAWLTVLMYPLQWSRDLFFDSYADGTLYNNWDAGTSFLKGDRCRYSDNSVYEALQDTLNNQPNELNSEYWIKVQDIWLGVRERTKYTSQKLLLEFALSRWFYYEITQFYTPAFVQPTSLTSSPDYYLNKSPIYINNLPLTNNTFRSGSNEAESSFVSYNEVEAIDFVEYTYAFNSPCFEVLMPASVYAILGSNAATREGAVRAVVDKYNLAGMTYIVSTY